MHHFQFCGIKAAAGLVEKVQGVATIDGPSIVRCIFLMACVLMRAQDATLAGDSIRELLGLSKKLAAVRQPPRVIGVQGATRSGVESNRVDLKADSREDGLCSASVAWQEQQVLNARLQTEWKEGQARAAEALTALLGAGKSGRVSEILPVACMHEQWKNGSILLSFFHAVFDARTTL